MKKFLKILGIVVILLLTVALYIMSSTGFFRDIEEYSQATDIQSISLTGPEDFALSRTDSFLIISASHRRFSVSSEGFRDGLYLIDLKSNAMQPRLLTSFMPDTFSPHGISMIPDGDGYQLMAVSHPDGEQSIEVFHFDGATLTHERTLQDPSLIMPNDLVLTAPDRFYVTNDHRYPDGFMRLVEDYGGLALCNLLYYDGNTFNQVATDISYANGVNYDKERKLVYVASSRGFLIRVFRENAPGQLEFLDDIDCNSGVDNIELDENGHLLIGAHPNLLRFASYAKGKSPTTPSEFLEIIYREKEEITISPLYLENGERLSAASVITRFGPYTFLGSAMDNEMLVLTRR